MHYSCGDVQPLANSSGFSPNSIFNTELLHMHRLAPVPIVNFIYQGFDTDFPGCTISVREYIFAIAEQYTTSLA